LTAPHVNLIPSEFPGDIYLHVAKHVWEHLQETYDEIPHAEAEIYEEFIDNIIELKKQIMAAEQRSDHRKNLVAELQQLKADNTETLKNSSVVFWMRVNDNKYRRKIVKRSTMTISYGSTPYGMGTQVYDDARKHGLDLLIYLELSWAVFLGRLIYEDCKTSIAKPMRLLSVFTEAGIAAEAKGEFLSWHTPIVNFPVVQHYIEGEVKQIWVQYGPHEGMTRTSSGYYPNTLQLRICHTEITKPSRGKQSNGASPNAIHSLDATHLIMTVCKANFPVTTIHDSYGCLLGDMSDLFLIVRETFVELYSNDPLKKLMEDIGGSLEKVEIGDLNVAVILESEYAFC
jgi:DNA-directed RNA polymerase